MVPAGEDPFIGEIAAFRFYESALSDAEVQQNYDAMRINVVSHDLTSASGATVVVNADGGFSYDPGTLFDYLGSGEIGTDTFSYTAEDASGNQDTATVTVTVNGVNDAPVAVDDIASTNEDTPVTVNVVSNDTDIEGDPLTVSAVTQGTNGAVTFAGGSVTSPRTPTSADPTASPTR